MFSFSKVLTLTSIEIEAAISIASSDEICHNQWSETLAESSLSNKGTKLFLKKGLRGSKYEVDFINNPVKTPIKIVDPLA